MVGHILYGLIFAAALVPGVPFGIALFGRRHPAAYLCGAVIGYAMTSVALWATIVAGWTSWPPLLLAWATVTAVGIGGSRLLTRIPVFEWRHSDTAALLLLLALALAIAVPPFAHVGERTPDGRRLYRAYFTADFVWHMALTAELAKMEMPPRNPYLAGEAVHYYWSYFILPAVVAGHGSPRVFSVESCLKANAIAVGLIFVVALYLLARVAVPSPAAAAIGVALALLASSAEGFYETWRLWRRNVPLMFLRHTNIDAVSNWQFHGLRIDGLQRCFWYVPQHMMAYTGGIVALVLAATGGVTASVPVILTAGMVLASSVLCNPLVGAMFAVGYGLTIVVSAPRAGGIRRVLLHGLAVLPVAAAIGWCSLNAMLQGASHALSFGLHGLARHAPFASLAVSLGPVLVVGTAGLLLRSPAAPLAATAPALVMAPLALLLMHFVMLDVDVAYIGFRSGHILICVLVMLTARAAMGLFRGGRLRTATALLFAAALVAGGPTTGIDWYNARDTSNRARSIGGFAWTIDVTWDEQEALRWLKRATHRDAIVQMEPIARGRETWSLIPSFAERRMAAGLPISLLHVREYDEGSREVQQMYETRDAILAHRIADHLKIDYIYVDRVERSVYPRGVEKFEMHPELFTPIFHNREVRVFAVH